MRDIYIPQNNNRSNGICHWGQKKISFGFEKLALTREQKTEQINELKEKLSKAQAMVLVNYTGINVAQDTELRSKFREANVDYKVYKNRIIKKALLDSGITGFDMDLKGSTAVAISYDDVVAPAKIIKDQSKTISVLNFKSGYVEGKLMDKTQLESLASIPSREVLIAQVLGLLQGTIAGLARGLAEVAKKSE